MSWLYSNKLSSIFYFAKFYLGMYVQYTEISAAILFSKCHVPCFSITVQGNYTSTHVEKQGFRIFLLRESQDNKGSNPQHGL